MPESTVSTPIASSHETGNLGICHLKRIWSATVATLEGTPVERDDEEHLDRVLADTLGIGTHQIVSQAFQFASSFEGLENWIVETIGQPASDKVERFNADLKGTPPPESVRNWLSEVEASEPALTPDDLRFWSENGYIILRNAVNPEVCKEAEQLIWNLVDATPMSPETWYKANRAGIMVEEIQHAPFERNRRSARIHKAFAQLWGTADLWVSADRCGFHPPQTKKYPFPGPDLHWDVRFDRPIGFGTQGILYLTDTPPEQGALTLVPGFHHRLKDWLKSLDPEADPQAQDLHALGSRPIGAGAGDMVIWHHALPHGSRPNLGQRPRIVQYINLYPGTARSRIAAKRDLELMEEFPGSGG